MRILFRKRFVQACSTAEAGTSESLDDLSNGLPSVSDESTGIKPSFVSDELSLSSLFENETISAGKLSGRSSVRLSVASSRNENRTGSSEKTIVPATPGADGLREVSEYVVQFSARSRHTQPNVGQPEPAEDTLKPSAAESSTIPSDLSSHKQGRASTDSAALSVLVGSTFVSPKFDDIPTNAQVDCAPPKAIECRDLNTAAENVASSHGRNNQLTVSTLPVERIKDAKFEAEEAIRSRKVFAIFGPYHRVRQALRSRGWVEKFYRNAAQFPIQGDQMIVTRKFERKAPTVPTERKIDPEGSFAADKDQFTTEVDDDDVDNGPPVPAFTEGDSHIPPWQERDGYYEIMSRFLRSATPNFIWSLRKSQVDFRYLRKDQLVNHHYRAPFTTKVGLCRFLSQIRWVDGRDCDQFFPRCFILSDNEEKQAFIDDFRLTACMSLLKLICAAHGSDRHSTQNKLPRNNSLPDVHEDPISPHETGMTTTAAETCPSARSLNSMPNGSTTLSTGRSSPDDPDWKPVSTVFQIPTCDEQETSLPPAVLDMAISRCELFLHFKNNTDIDQPPDDLSDKGLPWDAFLTWYYKARQSPELLNGLSDYSETCRVLCRKLKRHWPQFDLDGTNNVWIVKPGAKSRGRGIACYNQLQEMLNVVHSGILLGDARFVVQKYIENPLLVYKTKFDIRQWFLVTDWSPLTVWWYKVCYLRFCSQEFTLEDFSEAVHLSNNSIQHKYENGPRSQCLPEENMWTLPQFQEWLSAQGHPNIWKKKIEPAMKRAIIDSLLCSQEAIEVRKNSFGLYGADFLLTKDYKLWLIEINASPCMAPSTSVTAKLTSDVLDDTLKVVLDRRNDRNCDVGQFELIYRQALPSQLIYTGVDLKVEGTRVPQTSGDARNACSVIQFGHRSSLPHSLGTSVKKAACKNNCPQMWMEDLTRNAAVRSPPLRTTYLGHSDPESQESTKVKNRISKPVDSFVNSTKANVPKELEVIPIVRLEPNKTKNDAFFRRKTEHYIFKESKILDPRRRETVSPVAIRLYSPQGSLHKLPRSNLEGKRCSVGVTNINKTGRQYEATENGKRGNFHLTLDQGELESRHVSPESSQQVSNAVTESEHKLTRGAANFIKRKQSASYSIPNGILLDKDESRRSPISPAFNKKYQLLSPVHENSEKKSECSQKPTGPVSIIRKKINKLGLHYQKNNRKFSEEKVQYLLKSVNLPSIDRHPISAKRVQHKASAPFDQSWNLFNAHRASSASYSYHHSKSQQNTVVRIKKRPSALKGPSNAKAKVIEVHDISTNARSQISGSSNSNTPEFPNYDGLVDDDTLLNTARRILSELQNSSKMSFTESD